MQLGRFEMCLNVKDLKKSLAFYKKLGFRVVGGKIPKGWAILHKGDAVIDLFQGHIPGNVLNFRGGHASKLAAMMRRKGLALSDVAIPGKGRVGSFIARDPDGNVLFFDTAPGETTKRRPKGG